MGELVVRRAYEFDVQHRQGDGTWQTSTTVVSHRPDLTDAASPRVRYVPKGHVPWYDSLRVYAWVALLIGSWLMYRDGAALGGTVDGAFHVAWVVTFATVWNRHGKGDRRFW